MIRVILSDFLFFKINFIIFILSKNFQNFISHLYTKIFYHIFIVPDNSPKFNLIFSFFIYKNYLLQLNFNYINKYFVKISLITFQKILF